MMNFIKNKSGNATCLEEKLPMGKESSRARLSDKAPMAGASKAEYQWECPYCKGRGVDPHSTSGIKNCPACHGRIFWESDLKYAGLEHCEHCGGSGKTNFQGDWKICPHCHGAGRL